MRIVLFTLSCILYLGSIAQQTEEFPHKLGIKTSINMSTLLGTEFKNPRPKFGYTAGAYMHFNPSNKWSIYTEAVGSFRGSKFKNGDTGYSRIATFYVDMAALPTYQIPNSKNSVSAGPYASYLGLSSLYIGPKKKAELNDLNFKNTDVGLAVYYKKGGKTVDLQVGAKVALLNANDGVNFVGYKPKTGNGGTIRSLSFEIGMLF